EIPPLPGFPLPEAPPTLPGTTILPEPPVGSLPAIEGEEPDIDDSFFAADTSELGKAREQAVADLIGGTVANDRKVTVTLPNGKKESIKVDVFGPNGELVLVGGPAKASDLARLGSNLKRLSEIAQALSVRPIAAFEDGTPQVAIDLAIKQLGPSNVITFPQVQVSQ
ncbi:MAG: hypothetical protein Q6M04_09700, partial [Thermostichus sp. BF3_bins_97]